jgi:hypothetical protein
MDSETTKRFRRAFAKARCAACGAEILRIDWGRPARFCSDKCRKWHVRTRGRPTPMASGNPPPNPLMKTRSGARASPIDLVGGHWRGWLDPALRRAILDSELRLIPMPLNRAQAGAQHGD